MALYRVPRVGTVDITVLEHKFGMTGETIVTDIVVRWPNGASVSVEKQEMVADYLERIGLI